MPYYFGDLKWDRNSDPRDTGLNEWNGVTGLYKGFVGISVEALSIRVGLHRSYSPGNALGLWVVRSCPTILQRPETQYPSCLCTGIQFRPHQRQTIPRLQVLCLGLREKGLGSLTFALNLHRCYPDPPELLARDPAHNACVEQDGARAFCKNSVHCLPQLSATTRLWCHAGTWAP